MAVIPSGRNKAAMHRTNDAVWIRDDKVLWFGDGGDFGVWYDEDGDNVLTFTGADIRMEADQQIQFETSSVYITSSGDASAVSDSLILGGIPTSDTGVPGALYTVTGSDLCMTPYS